MDRLTSHEEIAELLGVYALDALPADEAAQVERHIVWCPKCAREVAEHHEVVGMLAHSGGDAPSELWDAISSRIEQTPHSAGDSPIFGVPKTEVVTDLRRRKASGGRTRYAPLAAKVATVAAAAVVIVTLSVQVGRLDHRVGQLDQASRINGMTQAVDAALLDPTAKRLELTGSVTSDAAASKSAPLAELVILSSGAAFAVNQSMPALPSDKTYQLWGVLDGHAISLGLLGSDPDEVAFYVSPGVSFTAYAVTAEPAGGVVSTTSSPVASASTV